MCITGSHDSRSPWITNIFEEFLAEVRNIPHKNLAVELFRKLISGEIKERRRRNVVRARSFGEMLDQSLKKYHNRAIDAVHIIEEQIEIARRMREDEMRGEVLGHSEEEVAFYDALVANNNAVEALGDERLKELAREIVRALRESVTVDWTVRENVKAHALVHLMTCKKRHRFWYTSRRLNECFQTPACLTSKLFNTQERRFSFV